MRPIVVSKAPFSRESWCCHPYDGPKVIARGSSLRACRHPTKRRYASIHSAPSGAMLAAVDRGSRWPAAGRGASRWRRSFRSRPSPPSPPVTSVEVVVGHSSPPRPRHRAPPRSSGLRTTCPARAHARRRRRLGWRGQRRSAALPSVPDRGELPESTIIVPRHVRTEKTEPAASWSG